MTVGAKQFTIPEIVALLEKALQEPITDGSDGKGFIQDQDPGDETRKQEDHVERMLLERHDLANRVMRLDAFLKRGGILTREETSDLHEQASFMRGYLVVLDRRLARAHGHRGPQGFGSFETGE